MKELDDLKNKAKNNGKTNEDEPSKDSTTAQTTVIDVTGEEARGGTSSTIFSCEQCSYKSPIKDRLTQHFNAKHEDITIPCEVCEYSGEPEKFVKHMKEKHEEIQKSNNHNQEKGKKSSKKRLRMQI